MLFIFAETVRSKRTFTAKPPTIILTLHILSCIYIFIYLKIKSICLIIKSLWRTISEYYKIINMYLNFIFITLSTWLVEINIIYTMVHSIRSHLYMGPLNMSQRALKLRVEKMASRYAELLWIHWIKGRGQPTVGDPPGVMRMVNNFSTWKLPHNGVKNVGRTQVFWNYVKKRKMDLGLGRGMEETTKREGSWPLPLTK
jgi:hypothetical protein